MMSFKKSIVIALSLLVVTAQVNAAAAAAAAAGKKVSAEEEYLASLVKIEQCRWCLAEYAKYRYESVIAITRSCLAAAGDASKRLRDVIAAHRYLAEDRRLDGEAAKARNTLIASLEAVIDIADFKSFQDWSSSGAAQDRLAPQLTIMRDARRRLAAVEDRRRVGAAARSTAVGAATTVSPAAIDADFAELSRITKTTEETISCIEASARTELSMPAITMKDTRAIELTCEAKKAYTIAVACSEIALILAKKADAAHTKETRAREVEVTTLPHLTDTRAKASTVRIEMTVASCEHELEAIEAAKGAYDTILAAADISLAAVVAAKEAMLAADTALIKASAEKKALLAARAVNSAAGATAS